MYSGDILPFKQNLRFRQLTIVAYRPIYFTLSYIALVQFIYDMSYLFVLCFASWLNMNDVDVDDVDNDNDADNN